MRMTLRTILNLSVKNSKTFMQFGAVMLQIWLGFLGGAERACTS